MEEINLGSFEEFLIYDNHEIEIFDISSNSPLPKYENFDALWVMGGHMNVWEEKKYPWLISEKAFIKNWVLKLKKPFFGICLGHQLLGEALGGNVEKSKIPEIGFQNLCTYSIIGKGEFLEGFPVNQPVLQGHSAEITDLSNPGASVLASSETCSIQIIKYLDHAFSVQFHPEAIKNTLQDWLSIPQIREDFHKALGKSGVEKLKLFHKKNLPILKKGAQAIYKNWIRIQLK